MAIGPPTGMRDWLPQDALLRQQLMEAISSVYRLYGYLPIDTPVMEDLAVLLGKGGGENEKLLFKILKRGEKLAQAKDDELADYGLRYDLTVPLARFVATHQGKIPKVFRRYHMGPVWRADRPQKGRYREFYQCDIDVVGGSSSAYEVEIITATERVLKELNLGPYRFRLSDKRLLPLLLQGLEVPEEQINPVAMLFDKLDKVSTSQITSELLLLLKPGSKASINVEKFFWAAHDERTHVTGRHAGVTMLTAHLEKINSSTIRTKIEAAVAGLKAIMDGVRVINKDSSIVFDPILVRGMDYYTGPVYEAVVEGFPSSILGGGRYDDLIGRFLGKSIPAVGCSLGFERILAILQERTAERSVALASRVLLICNEEDPALLQRQAERLRNEGLCVETFLDHDDVGKQFKYAEAAGITWAITRFDAASLSVTVRYLPERRDLTLSLAEFKAHLSGKNQA
jgi:histidyl-tRNA synthetase